MRYLLADAVRGIPVTSGVIRNFTALDPTLQQVIRHVQTTWPPKPQTKELEPFFRRRHALSIVDNCLMFSERIVIPEALRTTILKQFHSGHPGTNRMKTIARGYVYWPNLDNEIEQTVRNCSKCQEAAKMPTRQNPEPWPVPEEPWQRLHLDFAGPIDGTSYLVLVDAYSKWPEVIPVSRPTTSSTITSLRRIFSTHGLPTTIVSDNGSQFTSEQFEDFCKQNCIQHMRSPPYHPQSNGQAERFVDTFKRAIIKARGEGTTDEILQTFLSVYRTTPNPATSSGRSPAELLIGRKIRTIHQHLLPSTRNYLTIRTDNPHFPIGTHVYARDYRPGRKWAKGIIKAYRGSVLYDILVEGEEWVRHKNQLRSRPEATEHHSSELPVPLDLLLDTFGLSTRDRPEHTVDSDVNTPLEPRRTGRTRNPTKPIQVNPRAKRY